MPTLKRAWRAVCRYIARANTPATANPQTGSAGNVHWRNDGPDTVHADNSRLHGFYDWVKDRMLEAQRDSELVMQEEMRKDRRAKRRALSLLMKLLNPEQRQEFRRYRHFHVIGGSSGNRYRIRAAAFANIDVLGTDGKVRHRLCAHPAGDVPVYDVMAAQMLHLQDPVTEPRFLQRANIHPALSEDRVRSSSVWMV